MTRSRQYGVMTVAALFGTIFLSGCIFPEFTSETNSSVWQEPGLYEQLGRLEAAPPAGFTIVRQGPAEGLPFPDATLDELDGAVPINVEKNQTWCVCHWERVVIGLNPGTQMEQADDDVQRAGFIDFARLVVVADDAALEKMADKFIASKAKYEWGAYRAKVTAPLTFSNVGAALDAAGAKPTYQMRYAQLGHVQMSGGGYVVTYSTPIRVMQSASGHSYLEVAADDTARFHQREQSTGPYSIENATHLHDALATFMKVLDRPAPANVTFRHYHGD